jgi:amino acid adenylation domain-containing protein
MRHRIGGGSWKDLVKEVFETERELLPYRYYPLAKIHRDKGGQPLFETVFNFTNFHVFEKLQSLEQLEVLDTNLYAETNFTFWANFSLDLRSNEIILTLNGNAGSLSERQMEDIGGYYARTLDAMSHEPDSSAALSSLLSIEERKQILLEWNNSKAERPREDAIYQLFEAQVERAPDAIAVVCANQQITFRELNCRANRLARRLQSLGVGPEVRVGICAERSVEMVVGLLGILKAGGAYVPLDPSYPKDRIAFMLEDTQAPLLVAHQHLVASLPTHRAKVVGLDSDWESISHADERNLPVNVTAGNLAYVIYTSGSTGVPKGVGIEHRSALAFLHWARTVFAPEDWAGVLASTSICFDLSIFEIFGPLSWGGKLFLVENALQLATLDEAEDVRMINTVPSAMAELARLKAIPKSVRTVNLAGEALRNKLVQQIHEWATIQRVFNLYGPSEDTTYSTFAPMKKGNNEEPVIGRPIVNTQAYLLDACQYPVPIGVAGELQLGGEGLARGYINRPEITAEKFTPDQFGGEPGARVYRTGDLACYLPDGNLEFLGRIDHQVKIRGFRIELGEIEATLGAHPAVSKAVVLACNDGSGEMRLVAYLVADQGSLDAGALRGFLKQRLPDYMTPSTFVFLNELPLTTNGKVDRRALQALDNPRAEPEGEVSPPRDLLEFQLTQIWESALTRRPISVTDNFFDLGGHSLLAVRLLAQIKEKLRYDLPLSALVQAADIENLAHMLRQQPSSKSESPVVAIQPNGSKRPFFCVHPIGGNVLCYIELARGLGSEQPFYGLQADNAMARGPTDIEDMARRYVDETRKIQSEGPYVLGGWSFGGVVAYEMARQLQEQGQKVDRLVLFDSWAPSSSGNPATALREDDSAELMARFLLDIGGISGKDIPIDFDDVRRLDDDERLKFILEQAMKFKILPPDIELSRLNDLFVIFKRHVRAIRKYAPRPLTADTFVILFRAGEGKDEILDSPALGWDELLANTLAVQDVPGNHYSMLYKPHVQKLAHQVNAYLNIAA